jgi:hypothetical protein
VQPGVRSSLMTGGEVDPRQQMTDWINHAPPTDLAVELMEAFCTPNVGAGVENVVGYERLVEWMYRSYPTPKPRAFAITHGPSLLAPMSEAVQLLENSELVVNLCRLSSSAPQLTYLATRLGKSTFANGKAAVRERIRERTGL